jgi:hypothetical protein
VAHTVQNNFINLTFGYEKWFLSLMEAHKLKVSGNKCGKIFGPTRDDVTERCRTLHNEELCDLYRSASIVGAEVAQ